MPLAKKLKDCGVFGVSSDEYLNYAQQNRREWELNGKKVVEGMKGEVEATAAAVSPALKRASSNNSTTAKTDSLSVSFNSISASSRHQLDSSSRSMSASARHLNSSSSHSMSTSSHHKSQSSRHILNTSSHHNGESKTNDYAPLPDSFSILVVDNDKISRNMLSNALKKIAPNWKIDHADSVEAALHAASSSNFDLVFVDDYLGSKPGELLGSSAVSKLREQGFGRLICGMSGADSHATFKDAGADAFAFKPLPIRPTALTKELSRIISISSTD